MKLRGGIIYTKSIFNICEKLVILKLANSNYYFIQNDKEHKKGLAEKHSPSIFWMLISLAEVTHAKDPESETKDNKIGNEVGHSILATLEDTI